MWQTRTICTFVAATVPVENAGDESPLLDAARVIGLEGTQKTEEHESTPNEPQPGSFERFMTSFGSPARWAGR